MTDQAARDRLRRQIRERRRSLPLIQRAAHRIQIARIAERALLLRPGRRIAVYLATTHEADLQLLIRLARARGCRLYLPVVTSHRQGRMVFRYYPADARLRANRYGISEPQTPAAIIPVVQLDLVLAPLVAVDARGWRLGSGAGFYDRSLQRLPRALRWRRPKFIGVAYELQRVLYLAPAPWDVRLDGLITEKCFYRYTANDLQDSL